MAGRAYRDEITSPCQGWKCPRMAIWRVYDGRNCLVGLYCPPCSKAVVNRLNTRQPPTPPVAPRNEQVSKGGEVRTKPSLDVCGVPSPASGLYCGKLTFHDPPHEAETPGIGETALPIRITW